MPDLHGMDVSHSQPTIDWGAVATTTPPLQFVMARMTHGGRDDGNLRKDRQADANKAGMRAAFPNAPHGFYHFLGASTPAVQARWFRQVTGPLQPDEFVMLDVETDVAAGVGYLPADHIAATLDAIEAEFGVTPMLYIGLPHPAKNDPRLFRFPLVFPAYTNETQARIYAARMVGRPVVIWQWGGGANGAVIAGCGGGRIDSNEIWDQPAFRAALHGAGELEHTETIDPAPAPAPAPTTKDDDMAILIRDTEAGTCAVLDGGYTTGISGDTYTASTLPKLEVTHAEWGFLEATSDQKKAADKTLAGVSGASPEPVEVHVTVTAQN